MSEKWLSDLKNDLTLFTLAVSYAVKRQGNHTVSKVKRIANKAIKFAEKRASLKFKKRKVALNSLIKGQRAT